MNKLKIFFYPTIAAILFFSCGPIEEAPLIENFYGNVIDSSGVNDLSQVKSNLSNNGKTLAKLEGSIVQTCSKKGCWMKVAIEEDTVMVMFKDYGFFVPTEGAEGKTTFIEGTAYFDTISVEERQHFAEDAGQSEEEIAAITEPEYVLAFETEGVIIKQ